MKFYIACLSFLAWWWWTLVTYTWGSHKTIRHIDLAVLTSNFLPSEQINAIFLIHLLSPTLHSCNSESLISTVQSSQKHTSAVCSSFISHAFFALMYYISGSFSSCITLGIFQSSSLRTVLCDVSMSITV